jgi:hypothetical protein
MFTITGNTASMVNIRCNPVILTVCEQQKTNSENVTVELFLKVYHQINYLFLILA